MTWFAVRIEHPSPGKTKISVEEKDGGFDMLAFDSTPGLIGIIEADDPAHAAKVLWDRGKEYMRQRAKDGRVYTSEDLLRALLPPTEKVLSE